MTASATASVCVVSAYAQTLSRTTAHDLAETVRRKMLLAGRCGNSKALTGAHHQTGLVRVSPRPEPDSPTAACPSFIEADWPIVGGSPAPLVETPPNDTPMLILDPATERSLNDTHLWHF